MNNSRKSQSAKECNIVVKKITLTVLYYTQKVKEPCFIHTFKKH